MADMFHKLSLALIDWYDQHKRDLPWRKENPNPYHVWLVEVMSQQTTMGAVQPYFLKFVQHYPTVSDLANAPEDEVMGHWAGLGYYSRCRNLIKAARIIAQNGFPERLEDLPGVGRYTAAAINTMAFGKPDVVVDGNVERIVSRLFAVETPLPQAKPELYRLAERIFVQHHGRPGALAQGFMDLGTSVCRPQNPKCDVCPVFTWCQARSDAYPKRAAKAAKPERSATAYLIENAAGEILFERRPDKGLLGGTLGLPCTDLKTNAAPEDIEIVTNGEIIGEVRHVFTHFGLTMQVQRAQVRSFDKMRYAWMKPDAASGLSSLFAKALRLLGAEA